jgi:competence ComEA-like helix-hairpin-helix protein
MILLPAAVYRRAGYIAKVKDNALAKSSYQIDLNRADWVELTLIPGIGPRLAKEVVRYRKKHGPFRCLLEIQSVKGVGPAKTAEMATWVLAEDPGKSSKIE